MREETKDRIILWFMAGVVVAILVSAFYMGLTERQSITRDDYNNGDIEKYIAERPNVVFHSGNIYRVDYYEITCRKFYNRHNDDLNDRIWKDAVLAQFQNYYPNLIITSVIWADEEGGKKGPGYSVQIVGYPKEELLSKSSSGQEK